MKYVLLMKANVQELVVRAILKLKEWM